MLTWLAAAVLWMELPVPLYWFVLHPFASFWRQHLRAAYLVATLAPWGLVTVFLVVFHAELFTSRRVPTPAAVLGVVLFLPEIYLLPRVKRELGSARLVGKAEIAGDGELATTGLYACVRHPRYTAMMIAVAGACLLAGTRWVWVTASVWWLLVLLAIGLEERELRRRFGAAYEAYSQRVPRFLPIRFRPREE